MDASCPEVSAPAGNALEREKTMAKQSIFGRIAQLAKANINALLDSAEDPKLMLDQMVRDYTNSIADAESAIVFSLSKVSNGVASANVADGACCR